MTINVIVHLACWRTKILNLLGVLSALIFILWGVCSMVLLSIGAFLCVPTWCWLSTLVVIMTTWPEMGLYTLIVFVLKYCLFWGFCPLWFLSFGAFVLWCFCPFWLFSVRPRDVDCPHLLWSWSHDQKMGLYTLIVGVLKYCLFYGFCLLLFVSFGALSYGTFVDWGFSLCAHVMLIVHTCCDRDHMTRNGIVHLTCWRTKILPLLGVLSALILTLFSFCPMVLLSIVAFLCVPTWGWLPTPVVIVITWPEMGLYTLLVGVLKDCLFWMFCPLWLLSFDAFVLWCFCPLGLSSVCPRDVDCPPLLWSWSHD